MGARRNQQCKQRWLQCVAQANQCTNVRTPLLLFHHTSPTLSLVQSSRPKHTNLRMELEGIQSCTCYVGPIPPPHPLILSLPCALPEMVM